MTLQFNMVALLLVFLIVLGLISQNSAITTSAAVLLIMQQTLLSKYIPILEQLRCQNRDHHLNDWCACTVSVGKNSASRFKFIFKLENGCVDCNGNISRMARGERRAINE